MEAYDAAVLSYAIATATSKGKPNFLGLPHSLTSLPQKAPDESLTPPREATEESNVDGRNYLYQLLYNLEQMVINKNSVALSTLMEICSTKQTQVSKSILMLNMFSLKLVKQFKDVPLYCDISICVLFRNLNKSLSILKPL